MPFTMNMSQAVLDRMFPETADIESRTVSQDDEGGIEEMWSALFTDIPSQFSPAGPDTEATTTGGEFVRAQHVCHLLGDHEITEEDRCITRGLTFDIVGVLRNSYATYMTLHLEQRVLAEESSS